MGLNLSGGFCHVSFLTGFLFSNVKVVGYDFNTFLDCFIKLTLITSSLFLIYIKIIMTYGVVSGEIPPTSGQSERVK